MSIFDNIIFDEFTLLEGEQAEAYKKRKAEEKKLQKEYPNRSHTMWDKIENPTKDTQKAKEIYNKEAEKRLEDRITERKKHKNEEEKFIKNNHPGDYPEKPTKKNKEEYNKKLKNYSDGLKELDKKFKKDNSADKQYRNLKGHPREAIDATARHIRRHPKQYKESAFEDIEII